MGSVCKYVALSELPMAIPRFMLQLHSMAKVFSLLSQGRSTEFVSFNTLMCSGKLTSGVMNVVAK